MLLYFILFKFIIIIIISSYLYFVFYFCFGPLNPSSSSPIKKSNSPKTEPALEAHFPFQAPCTVALCTAQRLGFALGLRLVQPHQLNCYTNQPPLLHVIPTCMKTRQVPSLINRVPSPCHGHPTVTSSHPQANPCTLGDHDTYSIGRPFSHYMKRS